jgi:hypothetical protein
VDLLTSCHVLNRVSMKNKEKTPYEELIGKNLCFLTYAHGAFWQKLMCHQIRSISWDLKLWIAFVLGYAHHSIVYRFLVIKS